MNLRRLREGESSQVEGREENPRKKFKELKVELVQLDDVDKLPQIKKGRCNICRQYLEDVPYYNGHPNKSVPECTTLVDDRLSLFTGSESNLHQHDVRPSHKITHFSVYDKNGHLCPFDTGLIEGNKLLYFSGYVKPIYTEDTSTTNAIPTMEMGPINEWFTAGFDGGAKALVGFCTPYADYILQEPSIEYKPIFNMAKQKIYIAKIVIEFLANERWQNPTYEDLLQRLQATGNPELTEDALLRHAQFICDQVSSYDLAADDDEYLLITAPCMRALVKMAGVTFLKRKKLVKLDNNIVKKTTWSKATTTTLVHEVFETIFMDEIEKQNQDEKGPRRKRCGTCEACQIPDCGSCVHCRDMLKYGGTGTHKQACKMRRCPNMAIEDANAESDAEDDDSVDEKMADAKPQPCLTRITHDVKWIGEPIIEYEDRIYYNAAQVGDMTLTSCDYVMLYSAKPNQPLVIAEIQYMWEDATKGSMFHANLLRRGADTVLGETSDPRELFIVDICENCPLGSIVHKAKVEKRKLAKNWALNGGLDRLPPQLEDDGQTFFYSKRYNAECSRFEDIVERPTASSLDYGPCDGCRRRMEKKNLKTPVLEDGNVKWFNEVYRKGSGVFLEPNTFTNKNFSSIEQSVEKENIDAQLYPEFYRKRIHNQKGSNFDTPEPFEIGLIEEIIETSRKVITLKVRKFYRPEHTQSNVPGTYDKDLNLLYWSDKEYEVNFNKVKGKCYIAFGDGLQTSPRAWSEEGPYRFYFTEGYNHKTRKYYDVPLQATRIGVAGKGKGVGKGKSKKRNKLVHDLPPQWVKVKSPLNCMDVFAGCGGLSEGLHQSGVAATKWAIEKDPAAARAFELNNPQCNVYTGDCNDLLRIVMSGEQKNALPQKGEVEMLVGGPPCQGFSGMNRFNAGQYSNFKNSLIVSYLSYCDYYRPRYFILENVRNFVSFKRNMILKLTLRCLLAIGYQVTFGVLQAGHYGIAQTRRRLIIMAAAPGYALPNYPEPQHVFNKKGCQLSVPVDNYKYQTGLRWSSSAPYRTITVRDAMSDLPKITNGCDIKGMPYPSEAMSHFQRIMRHDDDPTGVLRDHICKEMAPIVEARITHIPVYPGSDWRDLPNIVVRLTDGYYTNKLKYRYRTSKAKKGDHPRGVCSCVTTNKCEPADRQFNTLIPWCLPHTADRHNHWAGLYGRLSWDGYFSTTITNPEPMGKQGRVLHPEQHRVVSVRECARSQGFPDRYCFYGSILDKHRQVGNAVPPPLGEALGKELQKAAIMGKLD